MKDIIIATGNRGKAKDFEKLLAPLGYNVLTLHDLPDAIDVEETGVTFEENAILKAETISRLIDKAVIADDSGIEIDALNGEPGVYSARYAGLSKSDEANNAKVLQKLQDVPAAERTARFRCVLAVAVPGKETETYTGSCEGLIATEPAGANGFGYDPLFIPDGFDQTMGQLTTDEKNAISHRGAAMEKLRAQWLGEK